MRQSLWIPLQLGDRQVYYDPQNGQLLREISEAGSDAETDVPMQEAVPPNRGADGPEDDNMIFDDPDIAMAARIATGVSGASQVENMC